MHRGHREKKETHAYLTPWDDDQKIALMHKKYSILKDNNVDSGVIFKFLPNSHITKAVCNKISKIIIFAYLLIFWYFWEKIKR